MMKMGNCVHRARIETTFLAFRDIIQLRLPDAIIHSPPVYVALLSADHYTRPLEM